MQTIQVSSACNSLNYIFDVLSIKLFLAGNNQDLSFDGLADSGSDMFL